MNTNPISDVSESAHPRKPAANSPADWRRLMLGAALLFVLVLAAYWPALRGEFVWDDLLLVKKNPLVKGQFGLGTIWFQTDFPLTNVALWLQWLAWGENPAGYHVVNVLLHAVSTALLWRVLARLKIPGAWLAAAIFAVHPVCVASVAWISELKNTLSLPFYLLSLMAYLVFDEMEVPGEGTKATRWYWLSLGAFLLALLAKTSTAMLPVVLLACAWWRRGRVARRDWLRTVPYFGLALGLGLMTVWFQSHQAFTGGSVQTEGFAGRLAGAGMAVWFYLGKALLPLNLNLIYPRWDIHAATPLSYLPVLLWCSVLTLCWRFRRSWGRPALFGLGCFTISLFPVLGFLDMYFLTMSRVSDHFQYLPLIALVALGAATLHSLLSARVLQFVAPALVLGLAVLTVQRSRVFAEDESLWRDTLARNPAAWCARDNLGCILAEQDKLEDAMQQFEASLKLNPQNAKAHCNLGEALVLQNRFDDAKAHFLAALRYSPGDAEIHKTYAAALAEHGDTDEALKHLRAALQSDPEVETRLQYATLLYQTRRFREAIAEYRRVLSLKPDTLEALNNLGWMLATCEDESVRDGAEAVRFAERACRLTGYAKASVVGTLAAAEAEAGRFTDAVATAQKAVDLALASGDVRFAEINRQMLNLYRGGKPFHQPSGNAGGTPPK